MRCCLRRMRLKASSTVSSFLDLYLRVASADSSGALLLIRLEEGSIGEPSGRLLRGFGRRDLGE